MAILRKKCRLTIAAVAATAASNPLADPFLNRPPHDCRSRGDCGTERTTRQGWPFGRLTIAAVAATAASVPDIPAVGIVLRLTIAAVAATAASARTGCRSTTGAASRLPQSRRLRHIGIGGVAPDGCRLTIAAVAATAARSLEHLENQHLPQHFASVR